VNPTPSSWKWTWGTAAALVVAGGVLLFWPEVSSFLHRLDWQDIHEAVRASGPWAPVLCILLNALFTVILLPTTVVSILVALLFGVAWGLPICLAGLALGMASSFLIARYLVRDGLERRIGDTKLYRRLEENMRRDGWKLVLFSRLLPINPYSFLNYAYGLTGISFGSYILASVIGIIPNVIALLWTVHAAGQLATGHLDWRVLAILFAGAGLFAALAWLPRLLRRKLPPGALSAANADEPDAET
jgi:uncharacterized membrane protein YdjX (TVP38/TMEM64 family)